MENKRKFPRVTASFQVKYYPSSDENHFGYTIANDVSMGGLNMPALSSIAKAGDVIRLDIKKSDIKDRIFATGRIKWTTALKRKALVDQKVGIEFLDISPIDAERLVKIA